MKLLLSQKNELFNIIEESENLTPAQFNLSEPSTDSNGFSSISLKESEYYFNIFKDQNYHKSFVVNYVPGSDTYLEASGRIGWDSIVTHFYDWIENLTRELNEPNSWERLEKEISSINFSSKKDNSKFTIREYEELKAKTILLSQNLSTIPLLVQQHTEIKIELERLTEFAKDLGKYDWQNLFIGTVISIIIQLNVTKENATLLWDLIKNTFNSYFLK
ncbi:hypothetical protein [Pontibacter burrus]|uniref:Uncharacterized protein n=1 Tax=Pontibacter burrus TaxID=2704466 RepID=A0A6B3LP00_9BACT|nr:hypothetical protein [Pontibacter burrus]NEM98632.1 hypothetical protein [Pontibacter burrus]